MSLTPVHPPRLPSLPPNPSLLRVNCLPASVLRHSFRAWPRAREVLPHSPSFWSLFSLSLSLRCPVLPPSPLFLLPPTASWYPTSEQATRIRLVAEKIEEHIHIMIYGPSLIYDSGNWYTIRGRDCPAPPTF